MLILSGAICSSFLRRTQVAEFSFLPEDFAFQAPYISCHFGQSFLALDQFCIDCFHFFILCLEFLFQILVLFQHIDTFLLQGLLCLFESHIQVPTSFNLSFSPHPLYLNLLGLTELLDGFLEELLVDFQPCSIGQLEVGILQQFIVELEGGRRRCPVRQDSLLDVFVQVQLREAEHLFAVVHDGSEDLVEFDHLFKSQLFGLGFRVL